MSLQNRMSFSFAELTDSATGYQFHLRILWGRSPFTSALCLTLTIPRKSLQLLLLCSGLLIRITVPSAQRVEARTTVQGRKAMFRRDVWLDVRL